MPRFLINSPSGTPSEFMLLDSPITIGRGSGCSLVLDHPFVSRIHARVEFADGHWEIADAGSRNGVLVNGMKLQGRHRLECDDRIEIVDITLDFFIDTNDRTPLWNRVTRAGIPERGLYINAESWEVYVDGHPVASRLSVQEFSLLRLLSESSGLCTMREIGVSIWGEGNYDRTLIHRLVHRLKEKVEPDPRHPRFIESTPRVGYRFRRDASAAAPPLPKKHGVSQ